VLRFNVSN